LLVFIETLEERVKWITIYSLIPEHGEGSRKHRDESE
jgi:hypothetical protein